MDAATGQQDASGECGRKRRRSRDGKKSDLVTEEASDTAEHTPKKVLTVLKLSWIVTCVTSGLYLEMKRTCISFCFH